MLPDVPGSSCTTNSTWLCRLMALLLEADETAGSAFQSVTMDNLDAA